VTLLIPTTDRRGLHLDPDLTFEDFVPSEGSRFVYEAALDAAESLGTLYNPLFIFGGTGLGKTHLLHAIGNRAALEVGAKVTYVTTEMFMNDHMDALQSDRLIEFKRRYGECDVLLIDDVQFLEHEEGHTEEFLHRLDELLAKFKQVVMTSDRPPTELGVLDQRFLSRIRSGLITSIDPPGLESRISILQKKQLSRDGHISDEALEWIAAHVRTNVRDLEGALTKVSAFARVNGIDGDLECAKRALEGLETLREPRQVTPEMIVSVVARASRCSESEIWGPSRIRDIAHARQIAMFLVREMTSLSYAAIGKCFADREATTVVHSIDKVRKGMAESPSFERSVREWKAKIRSEADLSIVPNAIRRRGVSDPIDAGYQSLQISAALLKRYITSGEVPDVSVAISHLEAALDVISSDDPVVLSLVNTLVEAHRLRYDVLNEKYDLDRALELQSELLQRIAHSERNR
jgi:chromosomal replication initiator protein